MWYNQTPSSMTAEADLHAVPVWQHHVAAIVIFLVWLELMMLIGRFPVFGIYVQMFTKGVPFTSVAPFAI